MVTWKVAVAGRAGVSIVAATHMHARQKDWSKLFEGIAAA